MGTGDAPPLNHTNPLGCGGKGGGTTAEEECRLVHPGVHLALTLQEDIVNIACLNPPSETCFQWVRVGRLSLCSQAPAASLP